MITIQTLSQIREDIIADLEAQYGDSIPLVGKVFLNALATVQAGKLKLMYLAIGLLQKNIFVDTADSESSGGTLERYGRIKLGRNPFPATAGQYEVSITGTIGGVIPGQTIFKSNDDSSNPGRLYVLDSDFELESSPDTITLRALTSGLDGKLEIGDELTSTTPLTDASDDATVTSETVEPLSAEDLEEYREKTLEAYRLEPQGGAAADYRLWAFDVQGVAKVYPYATSGETNEVDVYVEATQADSTDGHGTPTQDILDEVAEVIEFDPDTTKALEERGRRPLGVFEVNVLAITPKPIEIEIVGLVGATEDDELLIETALEDMIDEIRPFVAGADVLDNKNDIIDTNKIIAEILGAVPGAIFDSVELRVDTVVVSTYTFTGGEIPYLDNVYFYG
jgi:uncharacterized phage protein gp47/JayE